MINGIRNFRSGKVITAFNKHETEKDGRPFLRIAADKKEENKALRIKDKDGNPVSHTIALDDGGSEKVMPYQGHTISVLGCRLQGGECLLDCEDTMIDNGPNKGSFTLKLKQFIDHFDHITVSSV